MTIAAVAADVGVSPRTVKRWLRIYDTDGLEGLLSIRRIGPHNDTVPTTEEPSAGGGVSDESPAGELPGIADVAAFLDSLPAGAELLAWSEAFRNGLMRMLGDVDRVSMLVNIMASLVIKEPEKQKKATLIIAQSVVSGKTTVEVTDQADQLTDEKWHAERMMQTLRARRFPFRQYRKPLAYVYFSEGAYLGIIVLWRQKSRPPISERTHRIMEALRPVLTLVLTAYCARRQLSVPIEDAFASQLHSLSETSNLSVQERRTLILLLLGMTYAEAATTLNVSINTVRHHLRGIHTKTGTRSQAELFAKFFTPRHDAPE